MVQYKYDAWGNHTVTDANGNAITDANHIGNLNPFRYRGYYFDSETGFYFLQSRYYDPEVGRFLNMDSIEYADPESVNGINLYAYCGNNPVMGYDPDGTWDWLRAIAVVALAVVAVAAVAAITVATGGSAAPVIAGAVIGGLSNTAISAGVQYATTGTVDPTQLLVDASIGMVTGAFGGSAIGKVGMAAANGITDFAGSIASDWVAGEETIDWTRAGVAAGMSFVTGFLSGGGAQRGKLSARKNALATRRSIQSKGVKGYGNASRYRFGLNSNKRHLQRVTQELNRESIAEIVLGLPDALWISGHQALAFSGW